jgi:hypothetical protein
MSIITSRWLSLAMTVTLSACSAEKPWYQFASNATHTSNASDAIHGLKVKQAKDDIHGLNPPHNKRRMSMP